MTCSSHRIAKQVRVRLALMPHGYGIWTLSMMSDHEVAMAYMKLFAQQMNLATLGLQELGYVAKVASASLKQLNEAAA